MNTFSLAGKERTILLSLIVLGVICLGATFMIDDEFHTRFWSNVLHNTVFFTGIGFMGVFFTSVCITAWAGWHTVFKEWLTISNINKNDAVLVLSVGGGNKEKKAVADFLESLLIHVVKYKNETKAFLKLLNETLG